MVVFAKESYYCTTEPVVVNQESKPSEQCKRISRAWIYKTAAADSFLNGDTQFIQIEILNLATICCLDFPAIAGVHGFKKVALIVASGHITHAVKIVRPFYGGGQNEITKQPKVYAFDTSFVSWARGWEPLRPEDCEGLWEHLVLEHLQAHVADDPIRYWRDKQGREMDFVLSRGRDVVHAIECKWSAVALDGSALKAFRALYPKGQNYLVTPSANETYQIRKSDMYITVCDLGSLLGLL
ncbi:MAG: DUF4143 domain-containing protein [Spartobacteria bacterium]|nr:DUF4143 domain-containing protein [Spartobacteria bacterium]